MASTLSSTALAPAPTARVSRAVDRPVDPGNDATCAHCGERVKFAARAHNRQVIANIYEDAVWRRVQHYHDVCYAQAGSPFGPLTSQTVR